MNARHRVRWVSSKFQEDDCDRRFYWERGGGGREAISLAPRLQPGDSKPELPKNRFERFLLVEDQEKPFETVQGLLLQNLTTGLKPRC